MVKICIYCRHRVDRKLNSDFCSDICRNKYYGVPEGEDPFEWRLKNGKN